MCVRVMCASLPCDHDAEDGGASQVGSTVTVAGWSRTMRKQEKDTLIFLEVNDGSCFGTLQVVGESPAGDAGFATVCHVASRMASRMVSRMVSRMASCVVSCRVLALGALVRPDALCLTPSCVHGRSLLMWR